MVPIAGSLILSNRRRASGTLPCYHLPVLGLESAIDDRGADRVRARSLTWMPRSNGLQMPPRAWRPGFEPVELSFCVPYFFHQERRGLCGTMILITLIIRETKNFFFGRFFKLLQLHTDTRLRDVQNFTGSPQAPFLSDGPKIEQMMVIEVTGCPLLTLAV
jgi:hypothetical protein